MTLSDELSKLAELRERGTLTDEEFTRAKSRLLNPDDTRSTPPFVSAVNTFRRSRADRVDRRGVRRDRASDGNGILGMAADLCNVGRFAAVPAC